MLPVLLLAAACGQADVGLGVLAVPGIGETVAGFLEDGHPVFVVHDLDGSVHVIEAVSTHIADDRMAWCQSSRTVVDVFHGSHWDPQGRYVAGPGPSDLGRYDFDLVDSGSSLVVSAYRAPQPRSRSPVGMAGPNCADNGDLEVHPFYVNSWPSTVARGKFKAYVSPPPPMLLAQASESLWLLMAEANGLRHCADLGLGGPSRHSVEYAEEKEAALDEIGEPGARPVALAQAKVLYEMLSDEAAELFLCPTFTNR